MSRGTVHQYKTYSLYPIGDTPRRGGWWYHTDIDTKKHWCGEPYGGPDTELARPKFVDNIESAVARIAQVLQDPEVRFAERAVQMLGGRTTTGEQIVPIMDALTNGDSTPASIVEYQVHVPKRGALEGLPDDVVVEVPAIVNRKGI